jgi:hypothetical protein
MKDAEKFWENGGRMAKQRKQKIVIYLGLKREFGEEGQGKTIHWQI